MKKIVFFVLFVLSAAWFANAQDTVFSFNSLSLPDTGFCNGKNLNGYFSDTIDDVAIKLYNTYNPDWDSWQGFAYSVWTDDSTNQYTNQWSAYPGYLLDSTFVLAYIGIDWNNNYQNIPVGIKFSQPIKIKSLYIANSTYTALTIKDGSQFSSPFSEDDYYKVIITGFNNGEITDQIEYFLADYRYGLQFVQKDWAFVNLTKLQTIDSLSFNVESSDVGDFGMNTPGYFIIDQIQFTPVQSTNIVQNISRPNKIKIYPNPANDYIILPASSQKAIIYDQLGHKLIETKQHRISINYLPQGIYIVRVLKDKKWYNTKLIIKH